MPTTKTPARKRNRTEQDTYVPDFITVRAAELAQEDHEHTVYNADPTGGTVSIYA